MSTPSELPVAILGGGLTGLTAAYRLAAQGRRVRLFESSDRIGGAVRSERSGDWLVEAGPNSLQESSAELATLLTELGLDDARYYAKPEAKNRYILRDGRPLPAPSTPPGLFTTPLFSATAKIRVLAEIFTRPRQRAEDLSLAAFARDHFGRDFVDYALNPFVSGVYAGNPEALSARHAFPSLWEAERTHGSIFRAQLARAKAKRARGENHGPPRILSFDEGLERLPRALAARLPVGSIELGARVEQLEPGPPWKLHWRRGETMESADFAAVFACLPAAGLASLRIGAGGERPLASLETIEYPPVSSLFLGYTRAQVAHPLDGFGMLIPQKERRALLGVLFSSSLFPRRAPDGHVALTVMTGGTRHPELALLPIEELLPLVRTELADLLGVRGAPVFVRRNVWPRAIPQYSLGYGLHLETIARCEQANPGLFIGGHVRDGIAMTACIASGTRLAAILSS